MSRDAILAIFSRHSMMFHDVPRTSVLSYVQTDLSQLDLFSLANLHNTRYRQTNSAEIRAFTDSHRSDALYQGTTLVGPYGAEPMRALAPEVPLLGLMAN